MPWSHVWPLLPCFALVAAAVALPGVAIQHLVGKMGTLLMAVLFIVIGGAAAGGIGVSLLPNYWQTIGTLFPPRHAVNLFRNVRYFGGHNIVTPIAVLGAYALVGIAVIVIVERRRKSEQPVAESGATEEAASTPSHRFVPKNLIAPIGFAVLLTAIFGFNYMSSGHEPIAKNMPFGVVGSSPLPQDAQGSLFSLDVTE
jgi:NADH:ubiquinone oxidoreductase subunit K